MKELVHRLSCLRYAVMLWASFWMLAIPLFHVHPGAEHHHGGVLHTHGVTVHTVLSSDLDGELSDHHDGQLPKEASSEVALVDHHSNSVNEHGELGFALLNDASERKAFKPFLTQAIAIDFSDVPRNDRYIWTVNYPVPIHASTIFLHEIRSRAPPVLLT
jgi:hypothetical protein